MDVPVITVEELAELDAVELIDVRPSVDYRRRRAVHAKNVPEHTLDQFVTDREETADQPIYVICERGVASMRAAQQLYRAGLTAVYSVEGGTAAWEAAQLPVIRAPKAFSLERQVRILAGLIILAGSALAYWIHPAWVALPAFIGAGLAFAGLSNACGMGMMLAKMPWNR